MTLSFTRREFYDLVWSEPMVQTAPMTTETLMDSRRFITASFPPQTYWLSNCLSKASTSPTRSETVKASR